MNKRRKTEALCKKAKSLIDGLFHPANFVSLHKVSLFRHVDHRLVEEAVGIEFLHHLSLIHICRDVNGNAY